MREDDGRESRKGVVSKQGRPGQDLLEFYLSLTYEKRRALFAGTARVARMMGVAQRTVQFWVQMGEIEAVVIGGRYKISLESLRSRLKTLQLLDD